MAVEVNVKSWKEACPSGINGKPIKVLIEAWETAEQKAIDSENPTDWHDAGEAVGAVGMALSALIKELDKKKHKDAINAFTKLYVATKDKRDDCYTQKQICGSRASYNETIDHFSGQVKKWWEIIKKAPDELAAAKKLAEQGKSLKSTGQTNALQKIKKAIDDKCEVYEDAWNIAGSDVSMINLSAKANQKSYKIQAAVERKTVEQVTEKLVACRDQLSHYYNAFKEISTLLA